AVKRLMKEAAELKDPTDHYHAQPLEDNLFEWHFTVRGPPDSDFDGGIYHGRIVLPPEYPMKPPSIILLTANGRFEVGKKICLSISGHHPETWQPSWSIRTALLAIIGFMPTKGEGAIGSLDYTPEERRALAKKSQDFCCEMCGTSMKTALLPLTSGSVSSQADKEAKELARQISFKVKSRFKLLSLLYGIKKNIKEKLVNRRNIHHFRKTFIKLLICSLKYTSQDSVWTKVAAINLVIISDMLAGQERAPAPAASTTTSLSPRQRRAQQQSQRRAPSSTDFNRVQQPRVNTNHAGSTVLIVLLTFALAALIFRRICLANEYVFE
ncbi:UB2J1 enzyme, partial [Campylorhamphus procurvoides]|nr:UB2J1 enzyme [Campylorhamphus procurvoides]